MKKTFMCLILGISAISAHCADIKFSYDINGDEPSAFGFGHTETYDVAILIDEPSLKGAEVTGISVTIPGADLVSETSVWLSKELSLVRRSGKTVNNPDIMSASGIVTDNILAITFDTPHIIDGPFYAGYSFTTTDSEDKDGHVSIAGDPNPNGLFIHASKSVLKWSDYSTVAEGASTMSVSVRGNFASDAASVKAAGYLYGESGKETTVRLSLANHGFNTAGNIEYTWAAGGNSGTGSFSPEKAIPAVWGASATFDLNIGAITDAGTHDLVVEVTNVNGRPNTDNAPVSTLPVRIYSFIPVARPLVEEYTGLWCGFCPQGYVAFETMKETYPGRFIGLAYHVNDLMDGKFTKPASPGSYPTAYINRSRTHISPVEIYDIWPYAADVIAPASVEVSTEWDVNSETLTSVTSLCFIDDHSNADFALCHALVADGLCEPYFKQKNKYAGDYDNPDVPGEWGRLFTEGTDPMIGLTFNDVVLSLADVKGNPDGIPSEITADETYVVSHSFNIEDIGELSEIARKYRDNLRIVSILIDRATGRAVNCNSSSNSTVVVNAIPDSNIVKTYWHDLQGRQLASSSTGICIRTDILSDGSRRTKKVIVY